MNLEKLIDKYGHPNILIDNHSNKLNQGIAIWGISDSILFDVNGVKNNNKYIDTDPFLILDETLNDWQNSKNDISAVGYISYDIKNYLYPHINFKKTNSLPYYLFIKPQKLEYYDINSFNDISIHSCLNLKQDILDMKSYYDKIKLIKKELLQGNSYQINFTMQKKYNLNIDPLELYLMIRSLSKPEYGYYFNIDNNYILSFSPEQFFSINENIIKSYPMKGTRPRSNDVNQDYKFKTELLNSEKDLAEHLMIVDLIRNDIGKISNFGSVEVNNIFNVKSYNTVYQMVSEISGKLNQDCTFSKIVKALFPGGSITGAPKESTMKIIDHLENYNRGIYTGSLGYIMNNGDMNFNIAIRTMLVNNNIGYYSVGGGIVWDSTHEEEWHEAQLKSKILDKCII